jgi:drug/metabolite transporter (DMT)-like permease
MPLKSATSLAARLINRLPQSSQAALFMVIACAVFAAMSGLIRHISANVPPLEIVFFRNLFGLLALAPWFLRNGMAGLKTTRLGLYGLRALVGMVSMALWFTAVTIVPLAEATALSFTAPLFGTVLAVLLLGEVVRVRRWSATLAGFAGAMIILRPTVETIEPGTIMVLISAATMATAGIFVKKLMATDTPAQSVAWMGIMMVPMSLVPALFVWQWPSLQSLLWLGLLGGVATIGHLAISRALTLGEVTAVLPYDFTRLPFAALIGYFAFAQVPDFWTWVGAAVIFGSSLYITYREARVKPDEDVPVAATAGASRSASGGMDVDVVANREHIIREQANPEQGKPS